MRNFTLHQIEHRKNDCKQDEKNFSVVSMPPNITFSKKGEVNCVHKVVTSINVEK